jgi:large subunit ribosomal protein L9
MKQQLLLLEDVEALGNKGEIVTARPGYVRNFLLPKGLAMVATPNTLRKQQRLQEERMKQAIIDRKESEALAGQIEGITLEIKVKVDPEGHMYGSVSAGDIAQIFVEKGIAVDRRNVQLNKPLKTTGLHKLQTKLKEGIFASFSLSIIPEGMVQTGHENVVKPLPVESSTAETPPES